MDVIDKESTFISKKLIQKEECEASTHLVYGIIQSIQGWYRLYRDDTGYTKLQNTVYWVVTVTTLWSLSVILGCVWYLVEFFLCQ